MFRLFDCTVFLATSEVGGAFLDVPGSFSGSIFQHHVSFLTVLDRGGVLQASLCCVILLFLTVEPFSHLSFCSNACSREKTEPGRAVTHDWLNHPKRKRVSGWPYAISSVRCNLMFETEGNEEDSEDGRGPACSMPDSLFSALILFSFFSFHFRCPRARVYYRSFLYGCYATSLTR